MRELLVATRNQGKVTEILSLLEGSNFKLKTLDDFEKIEEVEETGNTFVENANLKSLGYAKQTNCLTLADDSGLEVNALSGAPGVFSARFAGANASDDANLNKLLNHLKKIKTSDREARFICAMSVSDPTGIKFNSLGVCGGEIALNSMGSNGFGYDPVFIPEGFQRTFGELYKETKEKVSHRTIALKKIITFLLKIGAC